MISTMIGHRYIEILFTESHVIINIIIIIIIRNDN